MAAEFVFLQDEPWSRFVVSGQVQNVHLVSDLIRPRRIRRRPTLWHSLAYVYAILQYCTNMCNINRPPYLPSQEPWTHPGETDPPGAFGNKDCRDGSRVLFRPPNRTGWGRVDAWPLVSPFLSE